MIKHYEAMHTESGVDYYSDMGGEKHYEVSDHLGNVRNTISNRKLVHDVGGAWSLEADVMSSMDYYPFGMGMPTRWHNYELVETAAFNTVTQTPIDYFMTRRRDKPVDGAFAYSSNVALDLRWVGKTASGAGAIDFEDLYNGGGSASSQATITSASLYGTLDLVSSGQQLYVSIHSGAGSDALAMFYDVGAGSVFTLDDISSTDYLELSLNVGQLGALTDQVEVHFLDKNFVSIKSVTTPVNTNFSLINVSMTIENSDVVAATGLSWDENENYYVMVMAVLEDGSVSSSNGYSPNITISEFSLEYRKLEQAMQYAVDKSEFETQGNYRLGHRSLESTQI